MSVYTDVTKIRMDAAALHPGRALLTLVAIVPILLGFVLRFAWMVPAFLWSSAVYGWRQADAQVKTFQPAARGS